MHTRKSRIRRTIIDIAMEILSLVILAQFLLFVQTDYSLDRQSENSETKLDVAVLHMENNAREAEKNLLSYDLFGQAKADTIEFFLEENPAYDIRLRELAMQWGLKELYILDENGAVIYSNSNEAPDFKNDPAFDGFLEKHEPVTRETVRYYVSVRPDGRKLVAGRESEKMLAAREELLSPACALRRVQVGNDGFIVAIDLSDDSLAYYPDERAIGQPASYIGLNTAALADGYAGKISIGADKDHYFGNCREVQGKYMFVALVTTAELGAQNRLMAGLALGMFAIVITLMVVYAYLLRRDLANHPQKTKDEFIQLGKRLYLNRLLAGKIKNVIIVGLIVIFAASFYTQSLAALSRQSLLSGAKLAAVRDILDENEKKKLELTEEYKAEYSKKAENIAFLLNADTGMIENKELERLAKSAQLHEIYVFDAQGKVEATNTVYDDFALSKDPQAQSYEFWEIIKGYTDIIVQEAMEDDTAQHRYIQYIGVKRLGTPGMIQIGVSPMRLADKLATTRIDYVLANLTMENDGYLFAVNKEDKSFAAYPKQKYIGRPATEYGISEAAFRDEYSGYQMIDSRECFVSGMEYGDVFIYTAVPVSSICSGRLEIAAIVSVAGVVVILLMMALLVLSKDAVNDESDEEENKYEAAKKEPKGIINIITAAGESKKVESVVSRWSGEGDIPWSQRTPEQKLKKIVFCIIGIAALLLVLYIATHNNEYDRSSILSYIINRQWEKTPNIFSFTYIALSMVEIAAITWALRKFIVAVTRGFGARSETVGRLLDNFIKYLACIGAVLYALNFLGVDSKTLVSSAGILTLIVGLGAQSLISDILAGIFIVFEGEFRVGDIVTVDAWRGTVLEIGIRTTKIEDAGSNIKIFNNSKISGVINMTKQYSYTSCDVGVDYSESLERVESVLDKELPLIKERLSAIVAGPFYKGVVALADSSVNIRIVAQCREEDRIQLGRDLNRELKLVFDKHNINIPFPQVVVNQPAQELGKATKAEKKTAEHFVQEQKELSKDIRIDEEEQ